MKLKGTGFFLVEKVGCYPPIRFSLIASRYNSEMIFAEGLVHRGHRLDERHWFFMVEKVGFYPPIRFSLIAIRYNSKMIFTDFFSGGKVISGFPQ